MKSDASSPACPRCGVPIPSEAPQGLCPRCVLLGAATSTEPAAGAALRPAPDLETVRAAFPQLEILRLIGQGGMGFVYAARQPQLDRLVALKLLPVAAGSDPAFAERFAREGRLLARLNHPNIVSVYEFGQAPGFGYLILEFVDGVNLRQAMRSGRFSPSEALAIVPRICEALQYAHDQGVLHRDIKPENILLDAGGRVKIADFGIAKLAGDRHADVTLTASGARLGTPHYMAPEQIEAPSAVDHRADIYSLGVVFYELLTGELPLGRFAPPSAKAELDARIDEIVMRALAKERELRQQSAGEVKTQVEGLGEGGPGVRSAGDPSASPAFSASHDFEYRSPRTLFGLPLVHVVSGMDPKTGRAREARGIIAMGPRARGGLAVGGTARGIVAIGGGAFGVFAFGGMACGAVAIGGMTLGLVSFGGLALALLLACGGLAVGWNAVGGLAIGAQAAGGLAFSRFPNPMPLEWQMTLLRLTPWLWLPALVPALAPLAVAAWVLGQQRKRQGSSQRYGLHQAGRLGLLLGVLWMMSCLAYGLLIPKTYVATIEFKADAIAPSVAEAFFNQIERADKDVRITRIRLTSLFTIRGTAVTGLEALEKTEAAYRSVTNSPWATGIELISPGRVPESGYYPNRGLALALGLIGFFGLTLPSMWLFGRSPKKPIPPSTASPRNPWPRRLFWLVLTLALLPMLTILTGLVVPALLQNGAVRSARVVMWLPLLAGVFFLWQLVRRPEGPVAEGLPVEWNPWPRRIFLAVVLLVLLPLLLLAAGLLIPYLSMRQNPPRASAPSKEYEAMTRPSQSTPDSIPAFFGTLSLEIPVGQTALVTARHWSNGVSQDLPVTNGVWTLLDGPPTPPSGFFSAGRPSQLMTNPAGSADWMLWLFSEEDLIPVGFPKAFVPRHSQIEMRLGANTVTNVWLFPDARANLPGSRGPRSGIEAILTTRASIPADQQYQEAARSLTTLHSQRLAVAGGLERLQRSRSWNKSVTPEKIEKQAAHLRELDLQVQPLLDRFGPLAEAVGWNAGARSSP